MNSKKPTVLCLIADFDPHVLGGAEVHFVEVARRLASTYNLILVTGSDTAIAPSLGNNIKTIPISYPKIPNFFGIAFIVWGFWHLRNHPIFTKIDLIWAKQEYPQSPLGALLKKKHNKPLYITLQNPRLHLEELVIKGTVLHFLAQPLKHLLTPLIAWSLRQGNTVAPVSLYSAKLANRMGVQKPQLIPNGVDLNTFPFKPKTFSKHLKIITTSSLIPRNGIDILITALTKLPPSISCSLTIAGDGPLKSQLQHLTYQLNLHSKITFVGRTTHQQIPNLLRQHHLFVRPSRWEGFGVSFIEAMATGLPVIACPVGGLTDFVIHKHTGLLAKPESPSSVANSIKILFTNKKLYKHIQKNARHLVESRYSWDHIASQVNSTFQKLL